MKEDGREGFRPSRLGLLLLDPEPDVMHLRSGNDPVTEKEFPYRPLTVLESLEFGRSRHGYRERVGHFFDPLASKRAGGRRRCKKLFRRYPHPRIDAVEHFMGFYGSRNDSFGRGGHGFLPYSGTASEGATYRTVRLAALLRRLILRMLEGHKGIRSP